MKYILRYMKPLAGRIMGGMSIKLFGTVMDLLIPYILAHIIDQVTPRHDVKLVLLWGGIMIVCSFLAWLGNVLANRVAAGVARDCTRSVRHDLFDHIVHMQSRDIDRLTIPSLISRMTTDTFYIYRIVGITQRLGVRAPIMLLGGILITLTMDWVLSLVLIAMLPLMCVLVYLISRKGVPLYAALQRRVDDLVRVVRENASGVRIIKALGKTEHEKERFAQVNTSVAQQETHASVIMAINNPTMQFILNAGLVLVILAGAQRVNSGLTEPGKIVAFLSYFTIILNAMLSITRFLTMYSKALASAHRLQEVLDTELEGSTQPAEPSAPTCMMCPSPSRRGRRWAFWAPRARARAR